MKRLYFIFLIALALLSCNYANAAEIAPIKSASSNLSQNNLTLTVGQYSESLPPATYEQWIIHSSVFSLSPTTLSEFENSQYCPVNKIVCALTLTSQQKIHFRLTPQTKTDNEKIKAYVEQLASKVNRQPSDAKFTAVDGKVTTFAEAEDGIKLDIEKSSAAIESTLMEENFQGRTISLVYDSQKATSDYGDVNNLGISSLLGEGTSDFKGSPVNRVKNIKVAMNKFNGVLIKPGEEFSFVKTLGDVDAEHGYFPELVIKNKITEPDFGGGICQVSSTVFRAAIYSGLKITARRNHAYPVSYYNPQGMDSTVYVPNPDLKFINNTPGYILVQAKIVGTKLIFDFYGTDDGRKTAVDGPYVTEKQPDGALKTTFTQHVTNGDGKEFISDVFNSAYASPYKYPHPGGPVLKAKPSNWSDAEWKDYLQKIKDMAKALKNAKQ